MGLRIYISDTFNWLITIHAHADFYLAILMRPRGILGSGAKNLYIFPAEMSEDGLCLMVVSMVG